MSQLSETSSDSIASAMEKSSLSDDSNLSQPGGDDDEGEFFGECSKNIGPDEDYDYSLLPPPPQEAIDSGGKPFTRDWANYDFVTEGPPFFEENEIIPEELIANGEMDKEYLEYINVGKAVQLKKEKEAKKKAEKEAKMKKFLEKKEAKVKEEPKAPKEKAQKGGKEKEKGTSVEEFLEQLQKIPPGTKKSVDGKLLDAYNPKYVESTWYSWWVKEGFFKPEYGLNGKTMKQAIEERGKFSMVIPPPNVTGTLHLGHALMCTVEDVLTRWHRMSGKVTLWVPGCDHAGIATQMVVEKTIARKEKKTRHDLGREEFTKRVWEWKEQKGGRIYEQLKLMGISADWDRESFTMNDKLSKAVTRAFVNLFEMGFIYRSDLLVNWSCTLKSCISDIEVDKVEITGRTLISVPGYKDKVEFGVLTYFAYKINEEQEIIVATTRPETMLGDVAIAVHPNDARYKDLIGKVAKHPFVDRDLVILADEFVEMEFGTGCVKITPAHDQNDYEVGKRHNLQLITVIDENGHMMKNCGQFSEIHRFDARKAVTEELKKRGLFRDSVDNAMSVPICSRSKDIIEPLIKPQWYMKCKQLAQDAITIVESGKMKIQPEVHIKTWNHWMNGIRDWCISRQLWWGHRIPMYKVIHDGNSDDDVWVAGMDEGEAMMKAKEKFPDATKIELMRDEDVLDTWFSSGLFPFSVFGWPDEEGNEDFKCFYPTDLLETGHDILFFWVARMVFMASTLTGEIPFKDVFLHSIVRDAHGRKMSKSLGNVIDPVDVIRGITLAELYKTLEEGNLDPKEIEKAKQGQKQDYPTGIPECGTDAMRFALCACMTQGRDINLDVLRVQGYRFFCNKIWNAVKFSMHYFTLGNYTPSPTSPTKLEKKPEDYDRMDHWILNKLSIAIKGADEGLKNYNFQTSSTAVYNFWLYDFCDVYLESLKPKFYGTMPGEGSLSEEQKVHLDVLLLCVETGLELLAPFMPFLTEELWQRLPTFPSESNKRPPSICVAKYPTRKTFEKFESETIEAEVSLMNLLIHAIRSKRAAYNIPNKSKTEAFLLNMDENMSGMLKEENLTICSLSSSKSLTIIEKKEDVPAGSATAVISENCIVYILLKGIIDFEKEEERICKQLESLKQQIYKLGETITMPEYSVKVPKNVQEANDNKLKSLEGETEQLLEAMKSIQIMLKE